MRGAGLGLSGARWRGVASAESERDGRRSVVHATPGWSLRCGRREVGERGALVGEGRAGTRRARSARRA
eukprot:4275074-Prymnesium_polylepis.1